MTLDQFKEIVKEAMENAPLRQSGKRLYFPAKDKWMRIISERGGTMTVRNLYFYERFWGWLCRVFRVKRQR